MKIIVDNAYHKIIFWRIKKDIIIIKYSRTVYVFNLHLKILEDKFLIGLTILKKIECEFPCKTCD